MVILCGSLISRMESQTLSYNSPLYGRRTAQIRLTQIPFRYYGEFFPHKSRRELIEMYSVTGGVPKYIELFAESKDIYKAIERNVLNRSPAISMMSQTFYCNKRFRKWAAISP